MGFMKPKYLILFSLLAVFPTAFAENQIPGNFKNPVAVQEVLTSKRSTANAAWWGFDEKDSTDALQSAINSGASKIIVPYMGSDWVVRPIKLTSNQEIIFEPGVVVIAKKGEFRSVDDCLFTAYRSRNITVRGYGATFEMRKEDYVSDEYKQGQWRHIFKIIGCSKVNIIGLKLRKSGGDGIYIGQGTSSGSPPCTDILIEDCSLDDNYRQGISVISGVRIRINNCVFSRTSGHSPAAGIDFEPNYWNNVLQDIVVSNCVFESNQGYGMVVALHKLNSQSKEVSILFYNCLVSACKVGVSVRSDSDSSPGGLIEFRDCVYKDIKSTGILLESRSQNYNVIFRGCTLANVCPTDYNSRKNYNVPIAIRLGASESSAGIEFVDCYVYDNRDRNAVLVWPYDSAEKTVSSLRGIIYVYNSVTGTLLGDVNQLGNELDVKKAVHKRAVH